MEVGEPIQKPVKSTVLTASLEANGVCDSTAVGNWGWPLLDPSVDRWSDLKIPAATHFYPVYAIADDLGSFNDLVLRLRPLADGAPTCLVLSPDKKRCACLAWR